MGDMGSKPKRGSKKRVVGKRRRRSQGNEVLAWLPDGYSRSATVRKAMTNRWLASSFFMSNPKSIQRVGDSVIEDMTKSMAMVAASVSAGGECEITISEPDQASPYWESTMSMVIDGTLHQTVIESLDANGLMTASLGWINQTGVK